MLSAEALCSLLTGKTYRLKVIGENVWTAAELQHSAEYLEQESVSQLTDPYSLSYVTAEECLAHLE